jgi:hypothetical protein
MSSLNIEPTVIKRTLASPKMSKVRPLSPYMESGKGPVDVANPLLKYVSNKKDINDMVKNKDSSPLLDCLDE